MPRLDPVPPLPREIEDALDAAGRQEDRAIDLAETALLLAAMDRPGVSLSPYRDHLAELVAAVKDCRAHTAFEAAAALQRVFTDRFGYDGDRLTYDDPQNANLIRVIDRRKGLPVALGVLFAHAARGAGFALSGLAFPGHFLMRLEVAGERVIIDPFNGGRQVEAMEMRRLVKQLMGPEQELTPQLTDTVGNRAILLRLQNNLKTRAQADGNTERVAHLARTMLRLAPEDGALWLDYAKAEHKLGRLGAASGALEQCIEHSLDGFEMIEAQRLLEELRLRLN
ncbi:transglutaminase-like domain-containing protein [Zavarzinia compransoris]|uniref:SirB1 family protein n=1 Tax=Zavarzinia marina TaxID=2911065 RepID=UPI001F36B584|nr:transglutaminase-like domain-containing protein [Zavarzinia marina]MCF4165310.1 transglutaminase-like domain-containing protein [Zavarzinia marina]